jgi:transglutaminase-like putative cysteine protease
MPILSVRHLSRYRYAEPVFFGEHRIMFLPRESYDQRVLESRLVITPEPAELRYVHDVFGNCVAIARFAERSRTLTFESFVRLDHRPAPLATDSEDEIDASCRYPFAYDEEDLSDLLPSIQQQHPDPDGRLEAWARRFVHADRPTRVLGLLAEMTRTIRSEFRYGVRLHGGPQTPLETLELGTGSCRDFAMLMIEAARSLGLAARFVSGYIYTPSPAGPEHGRRGGGHTHAWARVYLPSCGWVEFDPTNGLVGASDLIRVAVARDPRQAVPLYGTWSGPSGAYEGLDVEVDVDVEAAPGPLDPVRPRTLV